MDALEFFLKNVQFTDRAEVYARNSARRDLIGYSRKAHLRGDPTPPVRGSGFRSTPGADVATTEWRRPIPMAPST
jgi:hypothetical protein